MTECNLITTLFRDDRKKAMMEDEYRNKLHDEIASTMYYIYEKKGYIKDGKYIEEYQKFIQKMVARHNEVDEKILREIKLELKQL